MMVKASSSSGTCITSHRSPPFPSQSFIYRGGTATGVTPPIRGVTLPLSGLAGSFFQVSDLGCPGQKSEPDGLSDLIRFP
jgi:hypothetical protein